MKKNYETMWMIILALLLGLCLYILTMDLDKYKDKQLDKETTAPIVNKETEIDLDKIWMIESSRGKNLWNKKTRARGHYQFIESTWNECVKKMKKDWDWKNGSMDKEKSERVANYYYNVEIPRLLKYYKIDDSIETRIAAYNWGIGHLEDNWKIHKNKWREFAPEETKKYIRDYHNL